MRFITFTTFLFITAIIAGQDTLFTNSFSELKYRSTGPTRGGRVTAVAGIESQASVFYMGATGGGVWKTTDYGINWSNVSDGYFSTGSIGAIRVAQNKPDIVYAGTGSDGMRSNVIIGKGIYRSDNAGESWSFRGLEKAGQIGSLELHPQNPDICYVAAIGNPFGPNEERGLYKTVNGGLDWSRVLFISENTGICDIEICPDNPDIIYASAWTVRRKPWTIISGSEEGGVYMSHDAGDTWTKLSTGLPEGVIGKSDLAVSKANPDFVYLIIEAENEQSGVYFSDNRGISFTLIANQPFLLDRPFYYTNIDADPVNPDVLYVNSTGFYKSEDRGESWKRKSTPHGDNHDMWINPSFPDIMVQANDGGANVSLDAGISWSTQNNQPTAELYQVNVDDQFPYWLYAGQQDNSTIAISSVAQRGSGQTIMSVGGCETGPAIPKPGDHNTVYSNCKGRFGVFNKTSRQEKQYYVGAANMYGHNPADLKYRFQRVSPIIVSPHNPDVVYHASQYLHRTIDDGITWETISPDLTAFEADKQVISGSPITRDITGEEFYSTIYAIAESPLKEGLIWAGANDGPVHVTKDGGSTWTDVSPPGLPSGGRVQTIEASPHNEARAYIAVYRYLLNDWQPYIYMTNDYGQTWKRLTNTKNGIPEDNPTRVIREDPSREGLLYAGTESGLYISLDNGKQWYPFQQNLPVVPVTDIKIHRKDLILSTMGRAFWIMDDISPLHSLKIIEGEISDSFFNPRDAFRSAISPGAYINYYVKEKVESVEIRIIDSNGHLVRTLTGSGTSGFHRVVWDLRVENRIQSTGRSRGRAPIIVPGRYNAEVSIADQTFNRGFDVLADPEVVAGGMTSEDFTEQFDLAMKIMDMMVLSNTIKDRINNAIKPLNNKVSNAKSLRHKEKKLLDDLNIIKDKLLTAKGRYPQPMLADQISYLYSMISRSDQRPGKDAYLRYEELKENLFKLNLLLDKLIE